MLWCPSPSPSPLLPCCRLTAPNEYILPAKKNYLKRTMSRWAKILFSAKTFYRVIQMGICVAPPQIYYWRFFFSHFFTVKKKYSRFSHDLKIQTVPSRDPPLTDHFLPNKCRRCRQTIADPFKLPSDHARALASISQERNTWFPVSYGAFEVSAALGVHNINIPLCGNGKMPHRRFHS